MTAVIAPDAEPGDGPGPIGLFATLPLTDLHIHASQVRTDLGDLDSLTDSVRVHGVLQPLIVTPRDVTEGGWWVVAGQRRRAAAGAAGLAEVPCVIRSGFDFAAELIVAGLAENDQRKDITLVERVRAYDQLRIEGMNQADIATQTATKKNDVRKLLSVGKSDVATAVLERYDLTLEQALAIKEFDDDDDAVKQLTVTAVRNPDNFAHLASQLREDRKERRQRDQLRDGLVAAGYTVIEADTNRPEGAISIRQLKGKRGLAITREDHATCPGRMAILDRWSTTLWYDCCADWQAHGHKRIAASLSAAGTVYPNPGTTPRDRNDDGSLSEEAKAERALVVANNKAWRAATPVRQAFISDLLLARKPTPGMLRFCAATLAAWPGLADSGDDAMAAKLTKQPAPKYVGYGKPHEVLAPWIDSLPETRLAQGVLASLASGFETSLTGGTDGGVHNWRNTNGRINDWRGSAGGWKRAWLIQLEAWGYHLSELEAAITGPKDTPPAPAAAAEAEPDARVETAVVEAAVVETAEPVVGEAEAGEAEADYDPCSDSPDFGDGEADYPLADDFGDDGADDEGAA